jgi:integrase
VTQELRCSKGGFLDYANFEARILEPIRQKLGIPKLNFQILRRSYATRAFGEHKGTLKDIQKRLRHSRPDTTLENYVKDIPDSVYAMVDSMYEQIAGPDVAELLAKAPAAGAMQ